jgi:hypothetical protein
MIVADHVRRRIRRHRQVWRLGNRLVEQMICLLVRLDERFQLEAQWRVPGAFPVQKCRPSIGGEFHCGGNERFDPIGAGGHGFSLAGICRPYEKRRR